MSLTLEDIAQLAGVSKATVSRVVNNYPFVRPEVRERVQRIVKEHNYSPFPTTKVAPQRTRNIGLFLPHTARAFLGDETLMEMELALAQACERGGYFASRVVDEGETKTPAERQLFYQRVIASHACEGFVVFVSSAFDPLLPELIQNSAPVVLIGQHSRFAELPSVSLKEFEAASAVSAQLIKRGRVGMLTGSLGLIPMQNRLAGYKAALNGANMAYDSSLVMEVLAGAESISQIQNWDVDGVFAATPKLAQAASRVFERSHQAKPPEIKTIDFGNGLPPLEQICHKAVKQLIELIPV